MGWLSFRRSEVDAGLSLGPPAVIDWHRTARGHYHRLLHMRLPVNDAQSVGGVYIIWHKGVKPTWVAVGQTDDMNHVLEKALDDSALLSYDARGGLFVSWAPIKPEFRSGIVRYLLESLSPEMGDPGYGSPTDLKARQVPVLPPR